MSARANGSAMVGSSSAKRTLVMGTCCHSGTPLSPPLSRGFLRAGPARADGTRVGRPAAILANNRELGHSQHLRGKEERLSMGAKESPPSARAPFEAGDGDVPEATRDNGCGGSCGGPCPPRHRIRRAGRWSGRPRPTGSDTRVRAVRRAQGPAPGTRRPDVPVRRDEPVLPDVLRPGDDRRGHREGGRERLHGASRLGLLRHRPDRRHRHHRRRRQGRVLPLLGPHSWRPGVQRRRQRPRDARLHGGQGRRGRRSPGPAADQQLGQLRRDRPVQRLGRRPVPQRLLHRPDDAPVVQGLDLPPAQPGQHHHRRRVQGRPDDHGLGARQRTALRRLGLFPRDPGCNSDMLTAWVDEMSTYIKSIDDNHLVGTGDEGFLCDQPAGHWTRNCADGVDAARFAALPTIDYLSYHLYPDHWGTDAAWGTQWIELHNALARQIHKPAVLGEFGWQGKADRNVVYNDWLSTFIRTGGTGALYWLLSDIRGDGTLYPDYDGFTVYCPSPVCTLISNASETIRTNNKQFPPVADNDTATTDFGVPVQVTLVANDVAYQVPLRPRTVDLDPVARGRQAAGSVTGGIYSVDNAGVLTFTPAEGFAGRATLQYLSLIHISR